MPVCICVIAVFKWNIQFLCVEEEQEQEQKKMMVII